MEKILICTDLDRTLLPNGNQPESPEARPLFKKLAEVPYVRLAYVSGRDFNLLQEAVKGFELPDPDFMVGDVGTSIYHKPRGYWRIWRKWHDIIGRDWQGATRKELAERLKKLPELKLQEPEKQNRFKLSYYTDPEIDSAILKDKVRVCLAGCPIKVKCIFSVDEVNRIGLFDLLPERASKLEAIDFLVRQTGVMPERTVYAGDSGNDLEVLISRFKSVLVANAIEEVRLEAWEKSPKDALYIAKGDFMGMNGNYAAGLLEGVVHYLPELGLVLNNGVYRGQSRAK